MRVLIAGALVSVIGAAVLSAQLPTYGVTITVAKGVDPAKFKTYSWIKGGPSPDKTVDAQIVAAIDRELPGVGLTKAASGKPDVLVTYYSLRRTDVNLEAKPDSAGRQPQYPVGSLMDPGTRKRVVQLRTDKPLELEPAKLEAGINAAVTEMFAKYPTRQKK